MNHTQSLNNTDYRKVSAWFLGPKGENKELLIDLVEKSISEHADFRKNHYEKEEAYITKEIKKSDEYKHQVEILENARKDLSMRLTKSVPLFSQRYQAHMLWDTVIPGNVGYITAMLYNQNNVATEASPVTSELEYEVGQQLCNMLGFNTEGSWGHITADGTIANIEAMWAARNLKALSLAIKEYVHEHPQSNKWLDVSVNVSNGRELVSKRFRECSDWQLLNIDVDELLGLTKKISEQENLSVDEVNEKISPYLLQRKGIAYYCAKYPMLAKIKVIAPATYHYSWPKAAAILGLGQDNLIGIKVDQFCRMDMLDLESVLHTCIQNEEPVIMTVAVIGSTAESTIDNVAEILEIKKFYAQLGLQFALHCDAAWGGYMRTMILPTKEKMFKAGHFVPFLPLSDYAANQYMALANADTITVDPHKAGFIAYPAGSLCYRNGSMRSQITFDAAYIHSEGSDYNMGIYGLEGSKPGAAAAAVWLAHQAIPLNQGGYGQILGECSFSTKLYYCYWLTLANEDDHFSIMPLIPLPEKINSNIDTIAGFENQKEMMTYIKSEIIGKSNEEIAAKPRAMLLLQNVGADVLINTFLVNFKDRNGNLNKDVDLLNQLNQKLFERFSITTLARPSQEVEYILCMTTLSASTYAQAFQTIKESWELNTDTDYQLNILVNTIMQPWPNTFEYIREIMTIFRKGIESCRDELLK
jgi:vitellogenic carboxypeptidase-like protein